MHCIETEEFRNIIEKVIKKPKSAFKFLELVSDNRILEAIANYVISKKSNFWGLHVFFGVLDASLNHVTCKLAEGRWLSVRVYLSPQKRYD